MEDEMKISFTPFYSQHKTEVGQCHYTAMNSVYVYQLIMSVIREFTKQVGSSGNVSDLYSAGTQFESRTGHHLDFFSLLFLSQFSQIPVHRFKISHDCFLSHPLQFFIHSHPAI
jgi:hypothetical protein